MLDDATLLQRYATHRSEEAFAELVRSYLPLVYSAAVRRLGGDSHRAEDVAQKVFCSLARNARRFAHDTVLARWLYTATRNEAVQVIRAEKRRQARERESLHMQEISPDPSQSFDWSHLRPVLDAAMDELSDGDREAVLLRYFQNRPFGEVGTALGVSEDTARKRVERALEKLRGVLARRKLTSTSAALAALLASETISAAPATLAASITGAALTGSSAVASATTFFAMTKLQLALAAALVASGTICLLTQQHALDQLRTSNAALQSDLAHRDAEILRLKQTVALQKTASAAVGKVVQASTVAPRAGASGEGRLTTGAPAPANRVVSNPERLARYHRNFDAFVRQRGLTPEQAEKFYAILCEWDDVSSDFQALIRAQGLAWSPEAQKMRDQLQQRVEVEPLIALLGKGGDRAYFDFESSIFYRALISPVTQRLAGANFPLNEAQTDQLVALVKSNLIQTKPDPTSMGSQATIDWSRVAAAAGSFMTPEQWAVVQAEADRSKSR